MDGASEAEGSGSKRAVPGDMPCAAGEVAPPLSAALGAGFSKGIDFSGVVSKPLIAGLSSSPAGLACGACGSSLNPSPSSGLEAAGVPLADSELGAGCSLKPSPRRDVEPSPAFAGGAGIISCEGLTPGETPRCGRLLSHVGSGSAHWSLAAHGHRPRTPGLPDRRLILGAGNAHLPAAAGTIRSRFAGKRRSPRGSRPVHLAAGDSGEQACGDHESAAQHVFLCFSHHATAPRFALGRTAAILRKPHSRFHRHPELYPRTA